MKFLSLLPFTIYCSLPLIPAIICLPANKLAAEEKPLQLTQQQSDFFEKKIRPLLAEHCYKCHSRESDKVKGSLLLDSREATLRGGDNGHAVVPGNLNESLLYVAVTYKDSDLEMPPKYPLSSSEVADIETWIKMGAPDPRTENKTGKEKKHSYVSTINPEKGRDFWAYQKPVKRALPKISQDDWPRKDIDHFILAGLDSKGMSPTPDADAATLLRRLSFDLTGLPPSSDSIKDFIIAYDADPKAALAATADNLLDSEQFGERWGRHWMDVARYAESSGKETNALYPHAWRYRNYVIDSFNTDKPYDRFIQEQIAGDLIDAKSDQKKTELQIATGFLAIGSKSLSSNSARAFRFEMIDEQIDTATRAVLATSVSCARCHDHKFDPIPMSDYYSMAGIFLSSDTHFGTVANAQNRHSSDLIELPVNNTHPAGTVYSLGELIDMEVELNKMREQRESAIETLRTSKRSDKANGNARRQLLVLGTRIGLLESKLNAVDEDGMPRALAMGTTESGEPFDAQILLRGEEDNAAERASRGFIRAIYTGDEESIPTDQSGRLQLARWMTSPENPLTGRVMSNRIWYWLFGQGIVPSLDNFGSTGQMPSHPDLLDHLSIRFAELDWSVKSLVREIVLSRTYRMSSEYNAEYFLIDPENQWLWRSNKRRLDAESIRDSILQASGQLKLERPHSSDTAKAGEGFVGRTFTSDMLNSDQAVRSVYLPVVRDLLPDSLQLFDFADPSLVKGKRDITTVPSQALYLMNNDFVMAQAEAMARHLLDDLKLKGSALGTAAFHSCYSRPPTAEEARKTSVYFQRFVKTAQEENIKLEQARRMALSSFCQALFSSAEFRYVN